MEQSLTVPTATSVREIPVKLLEENRRIVNNHQALVAGPKISFTHFLAWVVVRALERHPAMNVAYDRIDDRPHLLRRKSIRLGLAIDVERKGSRVLLVPNINEIETLDFPSLVARYNDLVARARRNEL